MLPGITIAAEPSPGSALARLVALRAAEDAGLLTRPEVRDATRRLIRRAMDD